MKIFFPLSIFSFFFIYIYTHWCPTPRGIIRKMSFLSFHACTFFFSFRRSIWIIFFLSLVKIIPIKVFYFTSVIIVSIDYRLDVLIRACNRCSDFSRQTDYSFAIIPNCSRVDIMNEVGKKHFFYFFTCQRDKKIIIISAYIYALYNKSNTNKFTDKHRFSHW